MPALTFNLARATSDIAESTIVRSENYTHTMYKLQDTIKGLLALSTALVAASSMAQDATNAEQAVLLEKYDVREMKSFSDQAIPGRTPVAFTEVGKNVIAAELGSRDLPLVLNITPSVYATTDSGGDGDARINVRGFTQRNVSVLINGVPINDIENGWVYWSNWGAVGDFTSTIQVQRGLSNVSLPTPSIGGTQSIITDPAASRRGGSLKLESGSDQYYKATAVWNTGLIDGKFALSVGGVAKTGEGYVNGTYSRGLGYYIGATWIVNSTNRLELFAVGAPQRHGQRTFASNIAAYSVDYAKSLGFTDEQIYDTSAGAARQGPIDAGFSYNQNVAPVSSNYTGQQYYWGDLHAREDRDHIGERENYFHKPQINLNWYSTISDKLQWNSVFYYSGGRGGGSGTLNNGSSSAAFARYPNSVPKYGSNINWDATIASNAGTVAANGTAKAAGRSLGILRNSVNNQDQYGIISKLSYELTPEFTFTTGVDWRTAELRHFREVRDLLGGTYYLPTAAQASQFWDQGAGTQLGLGDKVDYNNTNTVDWLGLFATGQYQSGPVTAFAVYGFTSVDYGFTDHFRRAAPGSNEEHKVDPGASEGHQVKAGLNYELTSNLSVFANAGWVSKAPIFDGVINDIAGVLVTNPENENFVSYEAGIRWESSDGKFKLSGGAYHTVWKDRTISITNEQADSIVYLRAVNSEHTGVEIEGSYQPNKWIRFNGAASYGDWTYTNDVQGEVFSISTGSQLPISPMFYTKGVKVGDQPQSQIVYGATVYPTRGLSIKLQGFWYDRYWSDLTPESRTVANDRASSWQIPGYQIYNLHISYAIPTRSDAFDLTVFAHVFNLFDEVYISEAVDESSFESVGTNLAPRHSAQRAEVFFGAPLTFNMGVTVSF
jgi:hypothetical protein